MLWIIEFLEIVVYLCNVIKMLHPRHVDNSFDVPTKLHAKKKMHYYNQVTCLVLLYIANKLLFYYRYV